MTPTPGRIVAYTLTEQDAEQVNRRRHDVRRYNQSLVNQGLGQRPATGEQIHVGNDATAGETYPLVITRVWGQTDDSAVNGQVLLDGNDTLWVTSRAQDLDPDHMPTPGRWAAYPRVGA